MSYRLMQGVQDFFWGRWPYQVAGCPYAKFTLKGTEYVYETFMVQLQENRTDMPTPLGETKFTEDVLRELTQLLSGKPYGTGVVLIWRVLPSILQDEETLRSKLRMRLTIVPIEDFISDPVGPLKA